MNPLEHTALPDREALVERVKELECLYDISGLLAQLISTDVLMPQVCTRIAKAWMFSNDAMVSISLSDKVYVSRNWTAKTVSIKNDIIIDGEIKGSISVHYDARRHNQFSFLPEEEKLLLKLAQEIVAYLERQISVEKEEALKRIVERHDRLSIMGEMTAGIAHELNTPLGSILGFSEFILNDSKEVDTKKDAQKIYNSAMHAREVVKKLMFFSCEIPQKKNSVALNPLVQDAIEFIKPTIQKSEVDVKFSPDVKNSFTTLDSVQFTQVVFNLLINAIYASKPGDSIEISLNTDATHLNLKVCDNGCGIPEKDQEKIFEPFFTTKPIGSGTGLGLSVVHGIIKSHKGRIQFSSEINVGTTFVVSIPLNT